MVVAVVVRGGEVITGVIVGVLTVAAGRSGVVRAVEVRLVLRGCVLEATCAGVGDGVGVARGGVTVRGGVVAAVVVLEVEAAGCDCCWPLLF